MARRASLLEQCRQLLRLLGNPNWKGQDVNSLVRKMVDTTHSASAEQLAQGIAALVPFVRTAPAQEAGIAALTAGTMVEDGGPPDDIYQAVVGRLGLVLAAARRLIKAVDAAFPEVSEDDDEPPDAFWVGDIPVPRDWIKAHVLQDQEAVGAFNTLEQWCLPVVSAATMHRRLLEDLVARADLRKAIAPVAEVDGTAQFLLTLMLVPLREALLFVHVPTKRAFQLTMDGVPYNFDLHTLLAGALADALGHKPPPPRVLQCVRGQSPGSCKTYSTGYWQLYTWKAAAHPWSKLDKAPLDDRIWNEGRPADIPRFQGKRLILAADPTIERTWNTQATFEALPVDVQLERELPAAEAAQLMKRVREAAK